MRTSEPSSDLWDWPMSRLGQAAMAMLGLAIVLPLLTPLFLMLAPIAVEGEEELGWIVVPILVAGALAALSGVLALVAIFLRRERSFYLAFPVLGALIVVWLIVPGM